MCVLEPEDGERRIPAFRQPACKAPLQLGGEVRVSRTICVPSPIPIRLELRTAFLGGPPLLQRFLGHIERFERRPAEGPLGRLDLLDAQWGAMGLSRILLMRTSPRDVGPRDDQRWTLGDALRLRDSLVDRLEVVAVRDALHVPPVGLEAFGGIVGEREVRRAVDRNVIVVVEPDQLAKLQMTAERSGLVGNTLHEIAVGGQKVSVVIDDRMAWTIE